MISNAKQTNRKRPVGVTLLAILLGTYAVLMFVATGWAWAHPEEVHSWMTPENNIEIAMGVVIFTPLKMLMAAVLCFSLWNLQDWARRGTVVLGALSLYDRTASAIFSPTTTPNASGDRYPTPYLIRILLVLAVAGYLNSSGVVKAFRLPNELHE